jgi:flagellar basal-body rod modification protein FlgD
MENQMSNTIDPATGAGKGLSSTTTSKKSTGSNLSMNDFFTLLSAQLQYQDPMEPTDNSQFMAQMAQFSTLEQIQNMSKTVSMSTASSAMGKYAIYNTTDSSGKAIQGRGTVDAVDMSEDAPSYLINDTWITQSNVTQLYNVDGVNSARTLNLATAASAIGKSAVYNTEDSSGKTTQHTGVVAAVDLSSTMPSYKINGTWVAQSDIAELYDKTLDSGSTSA